jgi:ABC-type dipeptide/oligopeptide/nickel transport system ATPase component
MQLTKLQLRDFKRVKNVSLNLRDLNVIVGGNNSGKSSVLQGIHFYLTAAIASREAGRDTYKQEMLLFCPAHKFEELGHGEPYTNQSHKGDLSVQAKLPDGTAAEYAISIYRGRNEGNVGCTRAGNVVLGNTITDSDRLFSIYVPGLAGIPPFEQYRTLSVVRRGVASGEANLYLRNVLFQIAVKKQLEKLQKLMRKIFPYFSMNVSFNGQRDLVINVSMSTNYGEKYYSLDLAGTGVLQALQIFSYVTLFEPQLLLLDEPDSHLHPDNQALLANTLRVTASETNTQVILATHSRHLVESLQEDCNFIWLKGGKVFEQGVGLDHLPMLMEIGALNSLDRLKGGKVKWVFLSEDVDMKPLEALASSVGFIANETIFLSYRGVSNIETAATLAAFIKDLAPTTNVIIHRDRDFMTDGEVERVAERVAGCGARLFLTDGPDIETYFIAPGHIAAITSASEIDVSNWLEEIAKENHVGLQHQFTRKRDDAKKVLYKKDPESCPETLALLGNEIPLAPEKRLGKFMLSRVHGGMKSKLGTETNLIRYSAKLSSPALLALAVSIDPEFPGDIPF